MHMSVLAALCAMKMGTSVNVALGASGIVTLGELVRMTLGTLPVRLPERVSESTKSS